MHKVEFSVGSRRVNFNNPVDLDAIASSLISTGFQATNVGLAINEINRMVIYFE